MGKNLSREKIVDNFFFVGASLFARFFFIRFAGNPCYTGSIENCIQAQGQAEATPRRTLLRRCPFCMRGKVGRGTDSAFSTSCEKLDVVVVVTA